MSVTDDKHIPDASDVLLRFSLKTPFWPLSFSYGIFADPSTRIYFASLDHYLAYRMLMRHEHRERIITAPNGYIAVKNLEMILQTSASYEGDPVISPTWEQDRDAILDEGLRLKFGQSQFMLELLLRTGDRRIYDVSRDTDTHWFWCDGLGANMHGKALMRLREHVRTGGLLSVGRIV